MVQEKWREGEQDFGDRSQDYVAERPFPKLNRSLAGALRERLREAVSERKSRPVVREGGGRRKLLPNASRTVPLSPSRKENL